MDIHMTRGLKWENIVTQRTGLVLFGMKVKLDRPLNKTRALYKSLLVKNAVSCYLLWRRNQQFKTPIPNMTDGRGWPGPI